MIRFIQKNKIFVGLLTVIVLLIGAMGIYLLQGDKEIDVPLPPIISDPEEIPEEEVKVRAAISNFYGNFDDQGNTVFLYWDLKSNDSVIEKVELYSQDTFIADVSNTHSYEMPITVYQFATGNNEFELRCSLKNEVSLSEKTVVSVSYIFDVERSHQLIDSEEFGKVIEVTIKYTNNKSTPVGIPSLIVKDLKGTLVSTTFKKNEDISVVNNYVTASTTYYFQVNGYEPNDYTWNAKWNFDVVSLGFDYTIKETIKEDEAPLPDETEDTE